MRADILELFQSYSEPDEFERAHQLELFAWRDVGADGHGYLAYNKLGCRCAVCRAGNRDHLRKWNQQRQGKTSTRAYHCGLCGEEGHSARTCAMQVAA